MSWHDFLKGIISEKLIYIDARKIDNRKVVLQGDSIHIGDQVIDDKFIVDAVYKKIEESKNQDTLPFQVVHKDDSEEFEQVEKITIEQKESLEKLKKVLPPKQIECILMARRVHQANSKSDHDEYEKQVKELDNLFPEMGRKVKNLISGGYFDEQILPYLDVLKSVYGDNYVLEFRKYYDEILDFFPIAIFVNNYMTTDKLEGELQMRLQLKDIPFIKIHSMADYNIKKVDKIMKKTKIDRPHRITVIKHVTPAGLIAQITEIYFIIADK